MATAVARNLAFVSTIHSVSAHGGEITVVLVVPCFNEASRLATDRLLEFNEAAIGLVLVDDGSTDDTRLVIEQWASSHDRTTVHALDRNGGKGEAVRVGLLAAISRGPEWVGFIDADFATPPSALLRLIELARQRDNLDVVLGSRVAMLGRDIERSAFRHYTGRVFATFAAVLLGFHIYDSQCGAKLFRCTDSLTQALGEPFASRWAFDVELIGRLVRSGTPVEAFWEEPLECWHDIGGSRRSIWASVRSSFELIRIRSRLQRWT